MKRCKLLAWDLKELNLVSDLSKFPLWPWAKHQVSLVSALKINHLAGRAVNWSMVIAGQGFFSWMLPSRGCCAIRTRTSNGDIPFLDYSKACCHIRIVVGKLRELSSNSPSPSTSCWWLRFILAPGYEFRQHWMSPLICDTSLVQLVQSDTEWGREHPLGALS